jgi:hypothetical protein
VTDILEGLQQLLLPRLPVLFLDNEAIDQVLFGELFLAGGGVDGLFDDPDLAVADGDGDEVEEHLDVQPQGLIGLAGNAHPVEEEGEFLPVLAVVDHRIYIIEYRPI